MSASSSITPEVRIKLGLGWYNKHNNRYWELFPDDPPPKGKGRARFTDLHFPQEPPELESDNNSPMVVQVEESSVEQSLNYTLPH
jgi:hypothetical protein